jgi:hypothetical protein
LTVAHADDWDTLDNQRINAINASMQSTHQCNKRINAINASMQSTHQFNQRINAINANVFFLLL